MAARRRLHIFAGAAILIAAAGCSTNSNIAGHQPSHDTATPSTATTTVYPRIEATEAPPPDVTYAGQPTTTTTTTTTVATLLAPPPPSAMPSEPVPIRTDALFETNECELNPVEVDAMIAGLEPLVAALAAEQRLVAEGWTDDRGGEAANVGLSLCRAESVASAMVDEWPLLSGRIDVVGHGELDPPTECSGDCPANRVVIVSSG